MRAITVLCTLAVALCGLTSVAFAGCTEIPAPPINKRVNSLVKGYEPVKVSFTADRTDATSVSEKLGGEKFRFWIDGHVRVLFDRERWVITVRHCTLGAGKTAPKDLKTFVDVHYRPLKTEAQDHSGEIPILIPKSVVAAHPNVGISYDSGNELSGKWERFTQKGRSFTQLTLAPAE